MIRFRQKRTKFLFSVMVVSCLGVLSLHAQNNVSGIVKSKDSNEPVIGASVYVDGTTIGTSSGISGEFSLSVPKNATLIVSSLGYETVRIPVGARTSIEVLLEPAATDIDEIVFIGYGTARKSDLTSAITVVGEAEIAKTPITSIDQALQGNAAGVLVVNTSAEPGGEVALRIRGGSSISGDNDPLIVIDGFPSDKEALTMLNPNDVKSMEVLKDAAATAIFGSRGANGVVMITTKSGEEGRVKVQVSAQYGISVPRYKIPMMNGVQYAKYDDLARSSWGINSIYTMQPDTVLSRNYQNLLLRNTARRQEYSVIANGGNRDLGYYVSGAVLDEEGIMRNSGNRRLTLRAKMNAKLSRTVQFTASASIASQKTDVLKSGGSNALLRSQMIDPIITSADNTDFQDGLYIDPETGEITSIQYETAAALYGDNKTEKWTSSMDGKLSWAITKNLSFNLNGSYRTTNVDKSMYTPRSIYLSETTLDKNNVATRSNQKELQWIVDNTLNYSNTFKNKHYLNLTLGHSWQSNQTNGFGMSARHFDTDYYLYNNLAAGLYYESPTNVKYKYNLVSFFARAIYNYNKKILATFTIRSDGSSRFGEDSKFGYFPSASVAYVLSEENFIKDAIPAINNLKVRLSWGITGNDKIGQYQSISRLASAKAVIGDVGYNSTIVNTIGNDDLKWETTYQYNAGVDIGLWRNRVTLSADVYLKRTYDLLYAYRLPMSTGYSTVMSNIGNIDNYGYEIELSTKNIVSANGFNWSTSFNMGYNQSKVKDLGGNDNVMMYYLGDNVNQNITYLQVGKPLGVFKGYKTSIYKDWHEVYSDNAVWLEDPTNLRTVPGMMRYHDINGDGIIGEEDKVILGQALPKITGGFTNTFSYKNIDLTVFFNGAWGNSVVNANQTRLLNFTGGNYNQMRYALDTYRMMNPATGDQGYVNGKYPLPASNSHSSSSARNYTGNLTSAWIENGSYLRLKTITLGYTLPNHFSKKFGVSTMRISATGVNLWTWTSYQGLDPEMSSSYGGSNTRLGVDAGSYPATKGVTFAINVSF